MKTITRRSFLKITNRVLAVTGLSALLGPALAYFYPPKLEEMPSEPVYVCTQDELPVGSAKTVRFGRYPALVVNTSLGLRAYSAVCTHFACVVKYDANTDQIHCPCHEGYFDPLDGSVLSGPPPEALEKLSITIAGNEIFVGGPE